MWERVGDAVCTTNPSAGRGVTLGLAQAEHLMQLLEHRPIVFTLAYTKQRPVADDDQALPERIMQLHCQTATLALLRFQ